MTITPDQARELLDGATPGPWENLHIEWADKDGVERETWFVCDESDVLMRTCKQEEGRGTEANSNIAAAAPDLAQIIAGMTEEWGVEADGNALFPVNEEWHPNGEYFTESRADAEAVRDRMEKLNQHVRYRLVRRLVGPVEAIDGE